MFGRVFKDIHPDELELKVEHEGNSASFLNLDIRVEENQFVYKLYDKRDAFPFSIVRFPATFLRKYFILLLSVNF